MIILGNLNLPLRSQIVYFFPFFIGVFKASWSNWSGVKLLLTVISYNRFFFGLVALAMYQI
jgi:hypothetical protein